MLEAAEANDDDGDDDAEEGLADNDGHGEADGDDVEAVDGDPKGTTPTGHDHTTMRMMFRSLDWQLSHNLDHRLNVSLMSQHNRAHF